MNPVVAFIDFIFNSFVLWLSNIFVTPFTNLEVLWILIPIYLSLVISEYFQEKKGTSRGNAISNSVIVLWGGIDFLKQTLNNTSDINSFTHTGKLVIAICILIYGATILISGFLDLTLIKNIGRIFIVAYFVIIFTPIFYTETALTFSYIFGVILFFPLFYFVVNMADKYMPDPKALIDDLKEASGGSNSSELNKSPGDKLVW